MALPRQTALFLVCLSLLGATFAHAQTGHFLPLSPAPTRSEAQLSPASVVFPLAVPEAEGSSPRKVRFTSRLPERRLVLSRGLLATEEAPERLLQHGESTAGPLLLEAEMGDILVGGSPYAAHQLAGRGGKFSLRTGAWGNALTLRTFAATESLSSGASAAGATTGASAELGLFHGGVLLRSLYLGETDGTGGRAGETVGFAAQAAPFGEILQASAEADFTSAGSGAGQGGKERDVAYRLTLRGTRGEYRYRGVFEHAGSRYRPVGAEPGRRDREGGALTVGADLRPHSVELILSRYSDNTGNDPLRQRIATTEGGIDYTLRAFERLPVGLSYRKRLVTGSGAPSMWEAVDRERDTVSASATLTTGPWELGVKTSYYRQDDRTAGARPASGSACTLTPRFRAHSLTVTPAVTLARHSNLTPGLTTETIAAELDVRGSLFGCMLDYTLGGGARRTFSDTPTAVAEGIGARLRLSLPLEPLLPGVRLPTLSLRGEYERAGSGTAIPAGRYALLLALGSP